MPGSLEKGKPARIKKKEDGATAAQGKKKTVKPKKVSRFPIVGMGASAGGLETLQAFFAAMPPDAGMAFVVIQHLSPGRKSLMAALLDKNTAMSVVQIEDGMKLAPNRVYLNPPGKNVAILNRRLQLIEPVKNSAVNRPIDFFFQSLSQDQGETAIAIVLSGTASDGTMGIEAVKKAGGMVMVQEPDTAKYDGMPRSAIGTGLADFILAVEKMPDALIRYVKHPFIESDGKRSLASSQQDLLKIFGLLRSATGHDFSHYKPSTIARRIERRLAVHQIARLTDYIGHLQKYPTEIDQLFKDLVIGVTGFFRDPQAFEALEQQALADLLNARGPDRPMRLWVPGCSTGEEAYSLGMIFCEIMEKTHMHCDAQIFATDIDASAIEIARQGVYPDSIGTDVSRARLKKFFTPQAGMFKVKGQLRDMIVFSIQNLISDPPFSRMDLVSCRNLLIYLDAVLQKKILPLLHYALNPDGILFLGPAEGIGQHTDLFEPLDSKWRIFKCKKNAADQSRDDAGRSTCYRVQAFKPEALNEQPAPARIQAAAEKTLLEHYAPAGVLIDARHEILHIVGQTEKYLTPPAGRASLNILNMARKDLKNPLAATIRKAMLQEKDAACKNVRIKKNRGYHVVDVTVKPVTGKGLPPGAMLVVFEDQTPAETSKHDKGPASKAKKQDPAAQSLERELQSTREYLQATIEELEISNEQLKSANEELQSMNEETQSANEELETTKEELQSANEELATVNAELQNRVDELSRTSDDMHNLLAATQIASVFIDTQLRIKRYTPTAAEVIKLIPSDIGRPLDDLKTSFPDIDLTGGAAQVLKDLNTVEKEILSDDFIWYAMKVMPYRTTRNVIDGVVMTFVNIDVVKQAKKLRRFATVLEDANDAITVQDFDGNILAWNRGAQRMYGWSEAEALKMNISRFIVQEHLKAHQDLIEKLKRGEPEKAFRTQRRAKSGELLDIWLTATALRDESGRFVGLATTERDLAWLPPDKE